VVLTPGVCASSPAVMWRPDRARASVICRATGAIVHRSPRRARRTPLKPSAQGRPGDRHHLWSTPCALLSRTDLRVPPAPGLPCALWLPSGGERQQASGKTCRESAMACLQVELKIGGLRRCILHLHCNDGGEKEPQPPLVPRTQRPLTVRAEPGHESELRRPSPHRFSRARRAVRLAPYFGEF
jgi:hypothetical protein